MAMIFFAVCYGTVLYSIRNLLYDPCGLEKVSVKHAVGCGVQCGLRRRISGWRQTWAEGGVMEIIMC